MDGDFLSEDFCVLDGEHFINRCVLPIPVIGLNEHFGFGCRSTLSRANFDNYIAASTAATIPSAGRGSAG